MPLALQWICVILIDKDTYYSYIGYNFTDLTKMKSTVEYDCINDILIMKKRLYIIIIGTRMNGVVFSENGLCRLVPFKNL